MTAEEMIQAAMTLRIRKGMAITVHGVNGPDGPPQNMYATSQEQLDKWIANAEAKGWRVEPLTE